VYYGRQTLAIFGYIRQLLAVAAVTLLPAE
jgi:hypothetical protein